MAVFRHQVNLWVAAIGRSDDYVAASDLIPEVNANRVPAWRWWYFLGVACLFVLDQFFHWH